MTVSEWIALGGVAATNLGFLSLIYWRISKLGERVARMEGILEGMLSPLSRKLRKALGG